MVDFQPLYDDEGRRVLVFEVASRPMGLPVQVDGIAWWYEGDSLIPMPEEIRRRIYGETGFDFSGSICSAAKLSDLDESAIEAFRDKWIEKSNNKRLANLSETYAGKGKGGSVFQGVPTGFTKPQQGSDHSVAAWTPQRESCLLRRKDKRIKMVCWFHAYNIY